MLGSVPWGGNNVFSAGKLRGRRCREAEQEELADVDTDWSSICEAGVRHTASRSPQGVRARAAPGSQSFGRTAVCLTGQPRALQANLATDTYLCVNRIRTRPPEALACLLDICSLAGARANPVLQRHQLRNRERQGDRRA